MSRSVQEEPYEIRQEFYKKQKRNRTIERIEFLQRCIEEQVLPSSAPRQLKSHEHPFTSAAKAYLEDAIKSLQNKDIILLNRIKNEVQLPEHLMSRLQAESIQHRANLNTKLNKLCDSSEWNEAGNAALITNLSEQYNLCS